MRRISLSFLFTCVLLVAMLMSALAQSDSYQITWLGWSAGNGTSSSSEYRLDGTAAKLDAGMVAMSGGEFVLDGGFWTVETKQQQIYLPVVVR